MRVNDYGDAIKYSKVNESTEYRLDFYKHTTFQKTIYIPITDFDEMKAAYPKYKIEESGLYWDNVNVRLGMGISSPSAILHVSAKVTPVIPLIFTTLDVTV